MDLSKDPDRYDPAKDGPVSGRTLPELLGEGAHEDERDPMTWLFGLLGVLLFLAVVSVLLSLA